MDKKSLLEWQLAAGVDETTGDEPVDFFRVQEPEARDQPENQPPPPQSPISNLQPLPPTLQPSAPLHHSPAAAGSAARELADRCHTLAELEAAVRAFDGCAIKKTATQTVFSDGNPRAQVMIIGEAPGAQEDIKGIPFCGPSGQLLDKMLLTIGLDRSNVYIANSVFWRPPGNRQPSTEETTICLPFVEKHIALVAPKLLILCGGTATNSLLQKDQSISRLRGKFYDYSNHYLNAPIKTLLIYHPSYLLRQPAHKKFAWQDLLLINDFLTK